MKKSYLFAALFIILAGLWLWSGQWGTPQDDQETVDATEQTPEIQDMASVRAIMSVAQPYVRTITVRGQTQADRRVNVGTEIDARVVKISVVKGQRVKKGQTLIRLATDDRAAALKQAKAVVKQRELEFSAAQRLNKSGYRAETSTAQAEAALQSALADQRRAEINLANTNVRAPFDGFIEDIPIEIGAFISKGNSIATIVDSDPLLIVAHISEREINNVTVGSTATARLADGSLVEGVITFVSQSGSEATRTFRVEMETPNFEGLLRDGMTSELLLPVEHTKAHFLTPAILALDDNGQLGVRVVDENNTVQFRSLKVVGNDPKGVWVTGLGEASRVITVGQEFVVPGQEVVVELEGKGAQS